MIPLSSYFEHYQDIESGRLKVIDLRSPAEFALGAMPQALNIPLFTDAERSEVGKTYKQLGPRDAIQLGLEFVAKKIEDFVSSLVNEANAERRLIVHCWRGGMRSSSVGLLLRTLGYDPIVIAGGYKRYRHEVLDLIDELTRHPLMILNGRTGAGKTQLLHALSNLRAPVIDLEGLARHRGSALGSLNIPVPQPTQQQFENDLAKAYIRVRHSPKIIMEIEQNIGTIQMPAALRKNIYAAEMILIERPFEDRVAHIEREYASRWSPLDEEKFDRGMLQLKKLLSAETYQKIIEHNKRGERADAIRLLMKHRYDQCYDKAIRRQANRIIATVNATDDVIPAAEQIIKLLS